MRLIRNSAVIIIVVFTLLSFPSQIKANIFGEIPENPVDLANFLLPIVGGFVVFGLYFFGIVNALIEFFVVYFFLRGKLKIIRIIGTVLIVNVITTFPTMFLYNLIKNYFTFVGRNSPLADMRLEIVIAEVVPFVGEYFLWKWQLRRLKQSSELKNELSNLKILLMVVAANLVTLIIGLSFLLG